MSADAYEIPQAHIPIPDRLTYIPSWYRQHENLGLQVIDADDGDLGFTIGHVLPERRWAIDEAGRLIPQHIFETRYKQWCERILTPAGTVVEIKRFNKYFNVDLETVPGVDEFVDAKPDPSMPTADPRYLRYVPIAFSLGAETGRRKIRPIYTHTGEKIEPGKPLEMKAPLGFDAVVPPKAKLDEPTMLMACGKEQKVRFAANHKRFCKACQRASITAAQAEADHPTPEPAPPAA